jgi:hypothetical protein
MEPAVQIVLVALVVAGAWWALQPRYVFIIHLRAGRPSVTRGKVTAQFLDLVRDACADGGVSSGWVGGVRRGKRIRLAFSWGFPPGCRQRLRNLWNLHGWH